MVAVLSPYSHCGSGTTRSGARAFPGVKGQACSPGQDGEGDGGGHWAGREGAAPKTHQAGEGDGAREDTGPASKAPACEGSRGPILATAGQEMGRRTEEASWDQGGWCVGFQNMNIPHEREKVTTARTPPLQTLR